MAKKVVVDMSVAIDVLEEGDRELLLKLASMAPTPCTLPSTSISGVTVT